MIARSLMRTLWIGLAALGCGCIPSNVVAPSDRAVRVDLVETQWRAGEASDLKGYWISRDLKGPVASAVLRLHYWFEEDGKFTGAALLAGTPPRFVVLDGAFSFDADGQLLLGEDVEPARFEASSELLKLSGADGVVILQRLSID